MELVQVKCSEDMKDGWEQFVESHNGYSSVSGLIRRSVEAQIAREQEDDTREENVDSLVEEFDAIQSRIGQLQDTLKLTRQEALTEEEVYDLVMLANDEMIPAYVDEIEKNLKNDGRWYE